MKLLRSTFSLVLSAVIIQKSLLVFAYDSSTVCAEDARRLCPEKSARWCISYCLAKRRSELSRKCVDPFQATLASIDEYPTECFDETFMSGPGITAPVPVF